MDLITAKDLNNKLINKEISSYEVTKMIFERIKKSKLNSYITTCEESALKSSIDCLLYTSDAADE